MEAGLGGFPVPPLGAASKSLQSLALSSACSMPHAYTSPPPSEADPFPLSVGTQPLGLRLHC